MLSFGVKDRAHSFLCSAWFCHRPQDGSILTCKQHIIVQIWCLSKNAGPLAHFLHVSARRASHTGLQLWPGTPGAPRPVERGVSLHTSWPVLQDSEARGHVGKAQGAAGGITSHSQHLHYRDCPANAQHYQDLTLCSLLGFFVSRTQNSLCESITKVYLFKLKL